MALSSSDIQFRYSGGTFNSNPQQSFGGNMSPLPIACGTLSNLFQGIVDVTKIGDDAGNDVGDQTDRISYTTEYRAIYLINNNSTDTFYDVNVWVSDLRTDYGGSEIRMGIPLEVERQRITIHDIDKITGGNFTLKFGDAALDVDWDGVLGTGQNIENAIRGVPGSCETTVTPLASIDTALYDVTFLGGGRNKVQPMISVPNNALTSTIGVPGMSAEVLQEGSPINSIATDVGARNNAPAGVIFIGTSETSPINVGNLAPSEWLYIWFERVITPTASTDYLNDGFTLQFSSTESDLAITTLTYCQFIQLTYPQLRVLPY